MSEVSLFESRSMRVVGGHVGLLGSFQSVDSPAVNHLWSLGCSLRLVLALRSCCTWGAALLTHPAGVHQNDL